MGEGEPGAGDLRYRRREQRPASRRRATCAGRRRRAAARPVPRGGSAEVDIISGRIAAGVSALSDFVALHRGGRLRIPATSGPRCSALTPDVPTFREQGYAALELSGWHGVFAPANTPPAVVERLSAAIIAVLQTPAARRRLIAFGLEPMGSTPRALAARIATDTERWRAIIEASGVTPE